MNRWLIASLLLTVTTFAASLTGYYGFREQMLDRIPTHWGIDGQPDGWTTPDDALLHLMLLPALMLIMCGVSVVLPYLSPREFRIERFGPTYWYVMFLITILFGWIQFTMLLATFGSTWSTPSLMLAGIFAMLALMGNVMGKVKRNWWMGIRTPWTLASEIVWNHTHRLAAWLFVVFGVVGCIASLIGLPFWLMFAMILVPTLGPVIYSLILYKRLEGTGELG